MFALLYRQPIAKFPFQQWELSGAEIIPAWALIHHYCIRRKQTTYDLSGDSTPNRVCTSDKEYHASVDLCAFFVSVVLFHSFLSFFQQTSLWPRELRVEPSTSRHQQDPP